MAELRKSKWDFQHCATLWQGNLHKVAAPYFLLLCTWFSCIKKLDNLAYVGLSGHSCPQYQADSAAMQNGSMEKEEVESQVPPCGRGV